MGNRMTMRIFCLLAAFLGGCGGDAVGIFKAINAETKLNSDPSASGNILSIVRYNGSLYAAGGKIYHKKDYMKEGNWSESSKPEGLVVRLAAGYSEGKEYLYALTAKTDSKGSTEYKLYYVWNDTRDWQEIIDTRLKNLRTIFSNHAASTKKDAEEKTNNAYVVTDTDIYKLNGEKVDSVDTTDVVNGAPPSSIAAAYITSGNGTTYFADTAVFASDGTYLFRGDGTKISYGTATPLNPAVEIEGINNTIMSLWAHKKTETEEPYEGTLYIGIQYGAVKQVTYTVNTDTGTLIFGKAEYLGNAYATLGSYDIPVVFATPESNEDGTAKAVYASTVGTTATQGTKKNGLWGYYPGVREPRWDRE